ncbi:MAG TPA: hypothetical protein VHW09_22140 [Bryobacteraceae bacterium]|jgi:hypothetical protein|nr:hypothetical protein [Bryobacteraceae bacterium]
MKTLKTRRAFPLQVLGIAGVTAALASAQPKQNVSGARHPNLAAAQKLCDEAYQKVVAAQEANEFDMQGHAQKAKGLLEQASTALKAAALSANAANKKKG